MIKDNGGPAFPNKTEATGWDGLRSTHFERKGGMTLRDYFAAKAMAAIISTNPKSHVSEVSRVAFMAADAMIMERSK